MDGSLVVDHSLSVDVHGSKLDLLELALARARNLGCKLVVVVRVEVLSDVANLVPEVLVAYWNVRVRSFENRVLLPLDRSEGLFQVFSIWNLVVLLLHGEETI